jgi:hypothetical protein
MGLRKGMAAACSRSGTRQQCSSRPGSRPRRALRLRMRQCRAPGPRLRMAGGGGVMVLRATEEREQLAVSKNY